MPISINALSLRPDGAGVSTYIRELLHALPEHWQSACTVLVQRDALRELPPGVHVEMVRAQAGGRRALTGLLQHVPGPVHGLDVDLPLRLPGCSLATVHDLSVFDVPWAFSPVRIRGERALVSHALRRADLVLAVSQFTADRVRVRFGRDCIVTPEAPGRDMVPAGEAELCRVRERYALPAIFVLHVGTVEPRKDVPRLAEACELAGMPLLLAGGGTVAGLPHKVRRLGFVPRSDLAALFGLATVTAYISQYEGFGLPPVEALACGGRVVSTRVGDLPALLGDSVVWAPHDIDGLVRALREAASGERPAGPVLSWDVTATATTEAWIALGATP